MSLSNTQEKVNQALYVRVRAAFVAEGSTLNGWCRANGTHIQNVREAFFGTWQGPKADALVRRVLEASGVAPE